MIYYRARVVCVSFYNKMLNIMGPSVMSCTHAILVVNYPYTVDVR